MTRVHTYGNVPAPVATFHRQYQMLFISELPEDEQRQYNDAEMWECESPDEILHRMRVHPIYAYENNPDYIPQVLVDRETTRWFLAAVALGDRLTIGDIDPQTGEVIPGTMEPRPAIFFCEVTEAWVKQYEVDLMAVRQAQAQHPGRTAINPTLILEYQRRHDEYLAKVKTQTHFPT